MIQALKK